jgi:hypothetical protein
MHAGRQDLLLRVGVTAATLCPMNEQMSSEDLHEHLELLKATDRDERDELLTELLVHVYPSKRTQDN